MGVADKDNWLPPDRFLPVDSDGSVAADVPVGRDQSMYRGLGRDGLVRLLGLPAARNALCGMATANDQPEAAGLDCRSACDRCLLAPPIESH